MIDDDKELCSLIKKCLDNEEMSTIVAFSGSVGLKALDENKDKLSLIILDVMLPDLDGFSILKRVREISNVPVLMLTAKNSEEDKIIGLRTGADDYLTKPFSINELTARVTSLIRRFTTLNNTPNTQKGHLILKGMTIDIDNRIVCVNDEQIDLTGKEFDLLLFLANNKGRVYTKKQIYTQVWEDDYAFDGSNIMSFISKLNQVPIILFIFKLSEALGIALIGRLRNGDR